MSNFLLEIFRKLGQIRQKLTANWRIYLEEPILLADLAHSREAASIPSFGFFFLLISAAVIATLGLLANSSAVIIGAMIVAPLMNPILSMSFAIVTLNWRVYKRSLVTVILGIFTTVLVAYCISVGLPFDIVDEEVIGRTAPNLIDLGIAIAAGAAGAFSLTRKSIANSIAGVAIAVALVPPLCVVGIGLGIGNNLAADFGQGSIVSNLNVSEGAFLLFLVNLAGITFASCAVFLSQSYGNLNKALQALMIWVLILALLFFPLTNSMKEVFISHRLRLEMSKLRKKYTAISQKTQIRDVRVNLKGTSAYVTIVIYAPKGSLTDEYLEYAQKQIFNSLSTKGVKSMNVVVKIIPIDIRENQFISQPE